VLGAAAPAFADTAHIVPHDITFTSMVQQADWVVKAVMSILVLASVVTLTVWIAKTWEIISRRRRVAVALSRLAGAPSLGRLQDLPDAGVQAMVKVARNELERVPVPQRTTHAEGIKERVATLINRIDARQARQLSRGVSMLGSIGASAPFIGLFGTVWGIMNSFIGIAQAQTSNLAVVAPGIAEALLTTAFGLVAAVPAVLIYNTITRAVGGYRLRLSDAAAEVMCLLGRDLEYDGGARKGGLLHGI
jgi:biopolymer transport protein ExbB